MDAKIGADCIFFYSHNLPYFRRKFLSMNLHEYQSKELLKRYNVPIQEGMACSTPGEAEEAYRQIKTQYGSNFAVVKAQIHAGGRGKGKIVGKEQRGVAVGKNGEAVKEIAQNILGGTLVTIQTGPAGKVVNKVLVIRMEKTDKWNRKDNDVKLKVYVTYNELNSLEGSGATNFYADDQINADQFKLELSGANNSKLNISAKSLDIETSGASNATLSGQADKLTISSSGASNVKAYDLKAGEVNAESSGVSNIYVSAEDTLEVNASGLSNINYKGNAKIVTREVSKMANVKKH